MRIPARYSPVIFSALLSAIMVAIVSAFALAISRGLSPQFVGEWLKSCITIWPVAFPTVAVVAPLVRKLVGYITI